MGVLEEDRVECHRAERISFVGSLLLSVPASPREELREW